MNGQPNKLPNKFVVEFDSHHTLTLKERLMILLGYNIKTISSVMVNRRTQKVGAKTKLQLTKHVAAETEIRETNDCED